MTSALSNVVSGLESSGGTNAANQPAGMANPTYGQYTAFVSQYGSGAAGVDNYASQMLASNPNATLGDFYASYVTNTGNPANTTSLDELQASNPAAYNNLVNNAGYDPATPLSSLMDTGNLMNGPTDASSGLAAGSTSYVNPTTDFPSSMAADAYSPTAAAAAANAASSGGGLLSGITSIPTAIEQSFYALIQGIEDWFTRGFLIIIGLAFFILGALAIFGKMGNTRPIPIPA